MTDLHPDVALAIEHRKVRERYEEMREREPEIDLRAELRELAAIVSEICAASIADAPYHEDRAIRRSLHDRVVAVEGRLS